jgi:hypothetical protein
MRAEREVYRIKSWHSMWPVRKKLGEAGMQKACWSDWKLVRLHTAKPRSCDVAREHSAVDCARADSGGTDWKQGNRCN